MEDPSLRTQRAARLAAERVVRTNRAPARASRNALGVDPGERLRHAAPADALRILLIEDNPSDAFLVHEYLAEDPQLTYDLEHAESLAEAREALERFEPDIALIDLTLPDGNGLESFTTVHGWGQAFPIVILSGLDDRHTAVEAVRRGAQDYLPKSEINGALLTRVLRYAIERRRTERAIEARERRWRAMVEHSSDVIALLDSELAPSFVSESVVHSTGFTASELLGRNLLAFVHPNDRSTIESALQDTLAGDTCPVVTFRFRDRDGGWRWWEVVATNMMDDPAVGAIVVNAREIEERKRAEAESQRHKQILEAAIDSLPGVFYLFDETPRFLLWNRNLEETTGRTAEELASAHPADVTVEREEIAAAIHRAFTEGSATTEGHLLTEDGRAVPHFFTGQRFTLEDEAFVVGMGLDMTERHVAQRQVEFQASLLEQVKNSVVATDADGRVTYWNAYAEVLYGWTEEEALGRSILELNVPDDAGAAVAAGDILAAVAQRGRWEGEFQVRRKDGTSFPAWTTLATLDDGRGQPGFVGVSVDMTDRKQAEEERKALLGQLGERVKELKLLHEAALILQDDDPSLRATLDRIVARMPSAWRTPEALVARIRYEHAGTVVLSQSSAFRETSWMQSLAFETSGPGRGTIDVAYLREQSDADDGPFVDEERALLESLAQMLRAHLDRRHGRERNVALTDGLSSQLSRVAALQEISEATLNSSDLQQILNVILEQTTRELGVDASAILLFDPGTQMLEPAAQLGFRVRDIEHPPLRLGQGMGGKAALQRKPLAVPDVHAPGVRFVPDGMVEREGFVSYYSIPLTAKGRLQGLLTMFHRSSLEFPRVWREVAADIGQHAAVAIESASLFEELQRSNAELHLSYDRTIEGWARALDLKDEETAGHSQRVTRLTVTLARKLGVAGEDLANVRRGALLHDIGKMGVPDAVLLKPGKLDEDEWEVMKRHTTYAKDFLAGVPFLEKSLDIPYAHHEKWDGSGYPRGLTGEDIPFAARIFAVVDVFDALTNDRPYRSAWSHADARAHIEASAGTHFDPRVVAAFVELLDDFGLTTE